MNFQFCASSDRTWQETVPESGIFAAPQIPSNSDANRNSQKSKKSRWD